MATYYISPTGDDVNGDGSQSNPWKTTAHAIANSADGDTIIFLDGTYIWTATDYTFDAYRTFQAQNRGQAILDGGGANVQLVKVGKTNGTTIIDGLIFQNAYTTNQYTMFALAYASPNISTFQNCIFRNLTICGWGSGNNYHGGGLFGGRTYGDWNGTLTIKNCLIYNIYEDVTYYNAPIISHRDNGGSALIKLYNNTISIGVTPAPLGVILAVETTTPSQIDFKNNIFYNSSGETFKIYDNSYSPTPTGLVDYCCFYNIDTTRAPLGSNNITADPQLVDVTNGDFRLRPNSPCIDAGVLI